MTSLRLVVVGSANLDLVIRVPRLPAPGETVVGGDVTHAIGGKGANQAVAAARLGARAALVGAVGNDVFGDELRAGLAGTGLDVAHLRSVPGVPTGVALVQVRPDGENTITTSAGANGRLIADDVERAADLIGQADVLLLQLEVPLPVVAAAARAARGLVVLNAAPLGDDAPALADVLPLADVLVVNELEAAAVATATAESARAGAGAGAGPALDWRVLARRLRALGPRAVVVTLGADGAVAADADGEVRVPAYRVDVVDAVGAGDAFCAELAIALARGSTLAVAVRRACAAGALAATGPGAQGGPLTAELVAGLAGDDA